MFHRLGREKENEGIFSFLSDRERIEKIKREKRSLRTGENRLGWGGACVSV